jgi:hypothetical protein
MTQEPCRFWQISVFVYRGTRDEAEYEGAILKAREAMRDEVRTLDVMEPRLEGAIPIFIFGFRAPELELSLTAVCTCEGHEHHLGSLTKPTSTAHDSETQARKVYESACRAFEAQGLLVP